MECQKDTHLLELLNTLFEKQQKKLLALGREIIPEMTSEDLLQPMDFSLLELNPLFRFEEGLLMGIGETRAAILSYLKDN